MLLGVTVEIDLAQAWHRPGPVFGDPRLAPYRLGQQAFKAVVLDAYQRQCAITGTHIPPVLQAAHVRPVTEGGEHRLDNGLLLRSDVHTIFDRGYLGVDPKYRLVVSSRLREEFGNGEQFYAQAGQVIGLPARRADQPNREFLEWHLEEAFSRPEAEPTAQLNRAEGIRRALDRRGRWSGIRRARRRDVTIRGYVSIPTDQAWFFPPAGASEGLQGWNRLYLVDRSECCPRRGGVGVGWCRG